MKNLFFVLLVLMISVSMNLIAQTKEENCKKNTTACGIDKTIINKLDKNQINPSDYTKDTDNITNIPSGTKLSFLHEIVIPKDATDIYFQNGKAFTDKKNLTAEPYCSMIFNAQSKPWKVTPGKSVIVFKGVTNRDNVAINQKNIMIYNEFVTLPANRNVTSVGVEYELYTGDNLDERSVTGNSLACFSYETTGDKAKTNPPKITISDLKKLLKTHLQFGPYPAIKE